jgi:hypothetical protein
MIVIEDMIHCEHCGTYATFEEAIGELRRRASIPWDQSPNQAPCMSWMTCGREYHVTEFDSSQKPWALLRRVSVLNVSSKGSNWSADFEQLWAMAVSEGGEEMVQ